MEKASFGLILIALIAMGVYYAFIALLVCILICATCYGLYWIVRTMYVGKVKNEDADPLLTNISKWIVKGDNGHRNISPKLLEETFHIEEARAIYIIQQLTCANIIKSQKTVCKNYWVLGNKFRELNSNSEFFKDCLNNKIVSLKNEIDILINNSTNVHIRSTLIAFQKAIPFVMRINFLQLKKKAISSYAQQDIINLLDKQIFQKRQDLDNNKINIVTTTTIANYYKEFCMSITRSTSFKVWSKLHSQVYITCENFFSVNINGIETPIPCITLGTYRYYFFPTFVIEFQDCPKTIFKISEIKDIKVYITKQHITKEPWFKESEIPVTSTSYLHTCLDGTPDLRYKYNPRICYYGLYQIDFIGLDLSLVSGQIGFRVWSKYFEKITNFSMNTHKNKDNSTKSILNKRNVLSENTVATNSNNDPLAQRISEVISDNKINNKMIMSRSLISILNDYNVFQSIEEMAYPKILKAAFESEVMPKILDVSLSSTERNCLIQRFILSSGYDTKKTNYIFSCVFDALKSCNKI